MTSEKKTSWRRRRKVLLLTLHKERKFSIKGFSINVRKFALNSRMGLVTFTEEITNGKFFLRCKFFCINFTYRT